MKVPFVDLKAQYDSIRYEVAAAIQRVLESTAFAAGPFVAQFEKEFARYCGTEYALGVGSGTSALWLALLACGVGHGDEVITVPNTFIATAEAISQTGARPVFVDVDEDTYLMRPELLEAAITLRTKAIIPVHLYGQVADMDPIMECAKAHGLYVIEDACQAHGATYKGKRAGSIGDAGCFSFYPGKNLGAYGEGGAIITNKRQIAQRVAVLKDHGQSEKYYHSVIGWNDRMDGIQGAVLSVKLKYLDEWNAARRSNARAYNDLLGPVRGVRVPKEAACGEHIYHVYAVRVPDRGQLMKHLAASDVSCGIHYPVPIHLQEAYHFLGLERGTCPVAEGCCEDIVSLPMFAELTVEQIRYVADRIGYFFSGRAESLPERQASVVM